MCKTQPASLIRIRALLDARYQLVKACDIIAQPPRLAIEARQDLLEGAVKCVRP